MEKLMDISNGMLIDVVLNALGFLAAGGFSVLIYSAVLKRKETGQTLVVPEGKVEVNESENVKPEQPKERIELIQFDGAAGGEGTNLKQIETETATNSRFQRNRLEVIRQAREMLHSGKAAHEIRRQLPISAAELEFMGRHRERAKGQETYNG